MQGASGPARFWPIARKLGLGAGVAVGIGVILYSIGDMFLIGDSVSQTGNVGLTQYVAISLFGLFIFLLLGASIIRRGLAYNGQRLRGRGII